MLGSSRIRTTSSKNLESSRRVQKQNPRMHPILRKKQNYSELSRRCHRRSMISPNAQRWTPAHSVQRLRCWSWRERLKTSEIRAGSEISSQVHKFTDLQVHPPSLASYGRAGKFKYSRS